MYATKVVIMFLLAFSFFISTTCGDGEPAQGNYNDGMSPPAAHCGNCSICPYTCNTPPPSPPAMGYPSYDAPPPPPPVQAYCPPAPVQCCQYSPPSPFYYSYGKGSGSAQLRPLIKPFTSTWCLAIFFVSVFSLDLFQL